MQGSKEIELPQELSTFAHQFAKCELLSFIIDEVISFFNIFANHQDLASANIMSGDDALKIRD